MSGMSNDELRKRTSSIARQTEDLASDLGFAPPTPEQTVILGQLYACGAILELVGNILGRPDYPVLIVKIVEGAEGGGGSEAS